MSRQLTTDLLRCDPPSVQIPSQMSGNGDSNCTLGGRLGRPYAARGRSGHAGPRLRQSADRLTPERWCSPKLLQILAIAPIIEGPALFRESRPHSFDIFRLREFVGDCGDQHADIDVIELATLDQSTCDFLDFVVRQTPRQQRQERHRVRRRHTVGVSVA